MILQWYLRVKRGLNKSTKKAKILESGVYVASFMGLQGFGGVCEEG